MNILTICGTSSLGSRIARNSDGAFSQENKRSGGPHRIE